MSIVALAGSRTLGAREPIRALIDGVVDDYAITFTAGVTGVARGVGSIAREWLIDNTIPIIDVPCLPYLWKKYGKGAGHLRNAIIERVSDSLIAIRVKRKKDTPGTMATMLLFKDTKKPVYEIVVIDHGGTTTSDPDTGDIIESYNIEHVRTRVWNVKA